VRIAIIVATFPPNYCGVGDYTFNLARELSRDAEVTVLTTDQGELHAPWLEVRRAFDGQRPQTLLRVLGDLEELQPDYCIIQYDPYSYGARYSFNPFLPALAGLIRARLRHTRLAAVIHETFAAPDNARRALMSAWQRAQLFALGRSCHLLVFVIEAWARRFARWFPGTKVVHVPVGNNIPAVPGDRDALRAKLDISPDRLILGWFGRAQPTRRVDLVLEAVRGAERAGVSPCVLHVGVGADSAREGLAGVDARITGLLSPADVSRHLAAMDVYLAPIADGVSTRNTSMVSALAHGLPVIGTLGEATDSVLREQHAKALLLVDIARGESFAEPAAALASSPARRAELGAGAAAFASSTFGWDVIGTQIREALESR